MNVLFLLIMTKEMREAGACEGADTGFMCVRGKLTEQANNMEPQMQANCPEKVTTYQPLISFP